MRLWAMMKKELRQILRDRRTLSLIVFTPAALLLLFGYALSFDVKHIATGVLDLDRSRASRSLLQALSASGYFDVVQDFAHREQLEPALDQGAVAVGLVIPAGFERSLLRGEPAVLQSMLDGSNSQSATIVQGYVKGFVQTYSARLLLQQLIRQGGSTLALPVQTEARVWYNPELRSTLFLVPGLIVFILMISSTISTALSVVRERERGTMEQLLVSPLSPAEIIFGKTVPYIFISLLSASIILLLGWAVFDVEVRGGYFLLYGALTLFVVAALAQGILLSTVTSSQQVAFQLAALSSMLPSLLLSGFIFPIRSMPLPIQAVTLLVPARYFVAVLRAVMLKGVGVEVCWQELLSLAGFSIFMLGAASARLRRTRLV